MKQTSISNVNEDTEVGETVNINNHHNPYIFLTGGISINDFKPVKELNHAVPSFEDLDPGCCLFSVINTDFFFEFVELYTDEFGREKVRGRIHMTKKDSRTGDEISLFREHMELLFTYLDSSKKKDSKTIGSNSTSGPEIHSEDDSTQVRFGDAKSIDEDNNSGSTDTDDGSSTEQNESSGSESPHGKDVSLESFADNE